MAIVGELPMQVAMENSINELIALVQGVYITPPDLSPKDNSDDGFEDMMDVQPNMESMVIVVQSDTNLPSGHWIGLVRAGVRKSKMTRHASKSTYEPPTKIPRYDDEMRFNGDGVKTDEVNMKQRSFHKTYFKRLIPTVTTNSLGSLSSSMYAEQEQVCFDKHNRESTENNPVIDCTNTSGDSSFQYRIDSTIATRDNEQCTFQDEFWTTPN